jgi:membrane protein DedA with SNARE-associated domain
MNGRHDPTGGLIWGAVFILLGALFLVHETTDVDISFQIVLPAILILAGLGLIIGSRFR